MNKTYKEDSKEMEESMKDTGETEEAGDLFGVLHQPSTILLTTLHKGGYFRGDRRHFFIRKWRSHTEG